MENIFRQTVAFCFDAGVRLHFNVSHFLLFALKSKLWRQMLLCHAQGSISSFPLTEGGQLGPR